MDQYSKPTYDVVMPLDVEVEFPNICIGCGADSPTAKIKGSANAGGYINLVTPFLSRKKVVYAPACAACRKSHRWSAELLEVVLLLSVVGMVALLYFLVNSVDALQPLVDSVPKFIGKRAGMIIALIVIGPIWFILNKRIKPPLFEMDIITDGVEYKFRDAKYASKFKELNQNQNDAVPSAPDTEMDDDQKELTEEQLDEPNHNFSALLGLIGVIVFAFGGVGWYEDGFSSLNLFFTAGGLGLLALCVLVAVRVQRKFKRGEKHSGILERLAMGVLAGVLFIRLIAKLIKLFIVD
ncbi:MAG: hypothetical protein VX738_02380 [Planctomycetota bacterium]|nr:hypothetical protein [Planctomycetota bacterium]